MLRTREFPQWRFRTDKGGMTMAFPASRQPFRLAPAGLVFLLFSLAFLQACLIIHHSSDKDPASAASARPVRAGDITLPPGYRIEPVATGLDFPTGVAFDEDGGPYVTEAGYVDGDAWAPPRLLRIEPGGHTTVIAEGEKDSPWTGVVYSGGQFYVTEGSRQRGGRVLRILEGGSVTAIASDLPGVGDHATIGPAIGPDGWIYFGLGSATNSGVVGVDNAARGWLKRFPEFHDIPGEDITLAGENFSSSDPLKPDSTEKMLTGAFSPFGSRTERGQVIPGEVPCTGAVLGACPEGCQVELIAWGFRSPCALAFSPEGRLFATDCMYEERGSRPIAGASDLLWEVRPGMWYGWPDFHGGVPLGGNASYTTPGQPAPQFLLARHPNPPPRPLAELGVQAAPRGLDFSNNPAFGLPGQAFVALFGAEFPLAGKAQTGFKVICVEPITGQVFDFATNKGLKNGPASLVGGGGLERPAALRFDPQGTALYVVDYGATPGCSTKPAPANRGTGVLWRITRAGSDLH